jgi:FixJ family two-component response regulator
MVLMGTPMSRTTPIYVAVVDDDESLCRSLSRLLRAAGIQPITYASAEAFRADTKHPKFDCLVLDIQLGGISGIELAQRLMAEGWHTPVIYITAHDDPETRAEAEAAGCAAYFRKTDPGTDVLAAIRRVAT